MVEQEGGEQLRWKHCSVKEYRKVAKTAAAWLKGGAERETAVKGENENVEELYRLLLEAVRVGGRGCLIKRPVISRGRRRDKSRHSTAGAEVVFDWKMPKVRPGEDPLKRIGPQTDSRRW